MITVSQSGGSPDLVASTRAARDAGATTMAVTNNAGSPLAKAAEFHIDVRAGPGRALPATKTYTAELLALYLFVERLQGGDCVAATALPELAEQLLARWDEVAQLAARYRFAERLILTSRGYGYPTAKEAVLKLMETSYIPALAFSGADLLHGPVATVDNVCRSPRWSPRAGAAKRCSRFSTGCASAAPTRSSSVTGTRSRRLPRGSSCRLPACRRSFS